MNDSVSPRCPQPQLRVRCLLSTHAWPWVARGGKACKLTNSWKSLLQNLSTHQKPYKVINHPISSENGTSYGNCHCPIAPAALPLLGAQAPGPMNALLLLWKKILLFRQVHSYSSSRKDEKKKVAIVNIFFLKTKRKKERKKRNILVFKENVWEQAREKERGNRITAWSFKGRLHAELWLYGSSKC